jgi:hypothetical protein
MRMQIGATVIITPYDNPAQYQPDWRHLVAKAWRDNPKTLLPPEIANDEFIMRQIQYLANGVKQYPGVINKQWMAPQRAFDLYEQREETNVRDYLDPLLLTDQPYAVIAKDLGHTPETVQFYERVYWSCRAADGVASPSEMLKTSFAMGVEHQLLPNTPLKKIWLYMGARLGYTALTCAWSWQHPAGKVETDSEMFKLLTRMNIGTMFRMAALGQMQPIDINGFFSQYIAYERMKHETRTGGERNETMDTLLELFRIAAPVMEASAMSGEALGDMFMGQDSADAKRLIDNTEIQDAGPEAKHVAVNKALEKSKNMFRKMEGKKQL